MFFFVNLTKENMKYEIIHADIDKKNNLLRSRDRHTFAEVHAVGDGLTEQAKNTCIHEVQCIGLSDRGLF